MFLPLSVAIVCCNSQRTIGRTLESVAGLAAEIVAVDSGSTDTTPALLDQHRVRVIASPWLGHVRTKQLALEACTQPWVLCLDSDESLTPPLREAIVSALRRDDPAVAGYRLNRVVYYHDRPLRHAWQPEYRLRLVRQGLAVWTGLDPHDRLELRPDGGGHGPRRIERLPGHLRHDALPSVADFLARQSLHARTMAASLYRAGHRGSLWRLVLSPPGAFLKQIVLRQAWRDGWAGWLAAGASAAATLMKHLCLIELSRVRALPASCSTPTPDPDYDPSGRPDTPAA